MTMRRVLVLLVGLILAGSLGAQSPAAPSGDSIRMESRGGFGVYESETIQITQTAPGAAVTIVRKTYDGPPMEPVKGELSKGSWSTLWRELEARKVLELKDDLSLEGKVTDLYMYHFGLTRGGKSAAFKVFGPEQVGGEPRYGAVVRAIRAAVTPISDRVPQPSGAVPGGAPR